MFENRFEFSAERGQPVVVQNRENTTPGRRNPYVAITERFVVVRNPLGLFKRIPAVLLVVREMNTFFAFGTRPSVN